MSSFVESELTQALSEVPWGLRSSRLLPSTSSDEARAEVDLLEEGQSAVVSCRTGGWTVAAASGGCPKPSTVFDTLDDLLLAISPLFEEQRMHKLFEKLARVAQQQQDEEEAHEVA
ncbi:hypothetical protein JCM8097_003659 [Rhodosporidiobolus ruineniae]